MWIWTKLPDLHILYDDLNDPAELHSAEGNLEEYAPEVRSRVRRAGADR